MSWELFLTVNSRRIDTFQKVFICLKYLILIIKIDSDLNKCYNSLKIYKLLFFYLKLRPNLWSQTENEVKGDPWANKSSLY